MTQRLNAKKQHTISKREASIYLNAHVRQMVKEIVQDMGDCSDNIEYKAAFSKYLSVLNTLLKPYTHHLGSSFDNKHAEERFKVESSLLRLVTEIFRNQIQLLSVKNNVVFPIDRPESFFGWFVLPVGYSSSIEALTKHLLKIASPELLLSEICGDVLSDAGDSVIGEFYTPINIADHLISLSGITSTKIVSGKKVIDPACGAGIILLKLLSRLISSKKNVLSPQEIMNFAGNNLWGFDIQPFAIEISKTLMFYSCLKSFGDDAITDTDIFKNIKLIDTLSTDIEFWDNVAENKTTVGFDYIVSNPPFMTIKSSDITNKDSYAKVISGHPNLFQMFTWWAVCAANERGRISFLVPQSILSGAYYRKLRTQIQNHARILSITRMTHSKGVIADADLQMMAIGMEKTGPVKRDEVGDIQIRVSQNGDDINKASPFLVARSRVIKKINNEHSLWIIGGNSLDYDILQKIDEKTELFGSSLMWSIGTGTFVWNQNKQQLVETEEEDCLPLLSATSIRRFSFIFPYNGNHQSKTRQFSKVTPEMKSLLFSGPILLMQRTTPHKFGHRIVATIPPASFFEKYPQFFLENHVNYVSSSNQSLELLLGLLGWMNSDLFNYVFLIRNGSNVVSVNEMNYMPVKGTLLNGLAPQVTEIMNSSGESRDSLNRKLNDFIFKDLFLTKRETQRIRTVLSRKEVA